MATEWKCIMTLMVRALVNDLDIASPTYTDHKLQQLIVAAAQLIKREVDFNVMYTMDLRAISISPDPSDDDGFVNLVSLKTACLVLAGEVKIAASESVKIVDAGATVDLSTKYDSTKDLYAQICKDYEKAKMAYVLGNLNEIKAILTPYTVNYNTTPNIVFG